MFILKFFHSSIYLFLYIPPRCSSFMPPPQKKNTTTARVDGSPPSNAPTRLLTWKAAELRLWAVWWACAVTRRASRRAYEAKGRATSATDVFEGVGEALEEVSPSPAVEKDW